MTKDLKQENKSALTVILLVTFAAIVAIEIGPQWVLDHTDLLKKLGIVAIGTTLAGLLANILPADLKHRLVFLGHRNALPGHRCNRLCTQDARIDMNVASTRWPDLFAEETPEKTRNSLWYSKVYKQVKDEAEVRQSHRSFLLYRDATASIMILLSLAVVWAVLAGVSVIPAPSHWVVLMLAAEVVLFMLTARNTGNRMVVNAVSIAVGQD